MVTSSLQTACPSALILRCIGAGDNSVWWQSVIVSSLRRGSLELIRSLYREVVVPSALECSAGHILLSVEFQVFRLVNCVCLLDCFRTSAGKAGSLIKILMTGRI